MSSTKRALSRSLLTKLLGVAAAAVDAAVAAGDAAAAVVAAVAAAAGDGGVVQSAKSSQKTPATLLVAGATLLAVSTRTGRTKFKILQFSAGVNRSNIGSGSQSAAT